MKKNIVFLVAVLTGLLFGSSIIDIPLNAAVPAEERAALIALYNSTNGKYWREKTGWKNAPLEPDGFSTVGSEGTWYGITTLDNHVISIRFSDNNLNGVIPPELLNLFSLETLDLYHNKLSGSIPPGLDSLSKLTRLNLGSNQFSGSIPPELGELKSLTYLGLYDNQLSGCIPIELTKLSNLLTLGLTNNQLSGTILPELGTLSKLTDLSLGTNRLSGNIPPELGNLTELTSLSLGNNQLTGTIPLELGNLTKLTILDFGYNQLTGSIPPEVGNLTQVYSLNLNSNQLSGSIPPELSNLTKLWYLRLDNNKLSGSIPPEFGNFSLLYWCTLHSNQLSGSIPPELGNLANIRILYLNSNQLSGTIPPELGNLKYINHLKLDSNRLSGTIPPELGKLSDLSRLYLNSNQLTGSIPAELAGITHLVDDNSRFRWNSIYTDNEVLRDFLNSKQQGGDWESTQTIAPADVSAAALSHTAVRVSWMPITYTGNTGGYEVYYSTTPGGAGSWTYSGKTADKSTTSYEVTGLMPGTMYYFVVKTRTDPHSDNPNTVFSGYSDETSAMTNTAVGSYNMRLNRTELNFAFTAGSSESNSQTFMISSNWGTLNWSAVAQSSWLNINPTSGTGPAVVTVSVSPSDLSAGTYSGKITVFDPVADNSPQSVTVTLTVYEPGDSSEPFGNFASPGDSSTVSGGVPVTGWALDDIGVESVKIYREDNGNLFYIGDAVFVEGARPDIEAAYSGYPMNYRAGWGYMMLTHFLPDNGNGTFTLHAIAADKEGNQVTLGTKTITCNNADAVKPFGAIDTPDQGGTASGPAFRNHGWVLTPPPNAIPTDGSSLNVYVDGVYLGHPVYNIYRSDIAALFPGYANSDGAHAYFDIDTTVYGNGVHTIFWTAEDDAGNTEGIGSRYFTIKNTENSGRSTADGCNMSTIAEIPINYHEPVKIRKGYNIKNGMETVYPDVNGIITIEIQELDRVEVYLGDLDSSSPITHDPSPYTGYLKVGDRLGALPTGSTLDTESGVFYWQAGVAFTGEYRFVFIRTGENSERIRRDVKVTIYPKSE